MIQKALLESQRDLENKVKAESMVKQQTGNLSALEQVTNLGFPVELVFKALEAVGPDTEKMVDYIYKSLN